jgi:hypothetical protein
VIGNNLARTVHRTSTIQLLWSGNVLLSWMCSCESEFHLISMATLLERQGVYFEDIEHDSGGTSELASVTHCRESNPPRPNRNGQDSFTQLNSLRLFPR